MRKALTISLVVLFGLLLLVNVFVLIQSSVPVVKASSENIITAGEGPWGYKTGSWCICPYWCKKCTCPPPK